MNCDRCDTPFIRDADWDTEEQTNCDDNWGYGHVVYNAGEMQNLCTECFDNVMAMCCCHCDTYFADKYLVHDPDELMGWSETSPLCWDCYDLQEQK